MKTRAIVLFTSLAVLLVCFVAAALSIKPAGSITIEHQHEDMQQLSDLPEEDKLAASSLAIDKENFATHLPVVSIQTNGLEIPGELIARSREDGTPSVASSADDGWKTIPVDVEIREPDTNAPAAIRLSDSPTIETQAEMRIRGHSSREFDKKSYQLKFTKEDRVSDNPQNVLDMGSESSWVLNGPFLDKTLLRNYVAMGLFGEIIPYTPDVRIVELFINDDYQGVYILMESIRRGEDRVNIRKSDSNSFVTSFIVKRDWILNAENIDYDLLTITKQADQPYEIVYPSEENITPEQLAWIEQELNDMEKAIYSYDYDKKTYGYWNYLDDDSFVDYFIVNELALNGDAGEVSTFFYKDLGGKLTIGPIWDFNNAFDNYTDQSFEENGFLLKDRPIYYMLTKDEKFTDKVINRYRELRENTLSNERIISYIEEAAAYIEPAKDRNFEIWGYSFNPENLNVDSRLTPIERNPRSYEEALHDFEESFINRAEWLDRNIENLKQFSHESAVKKFND